MLHVICKSKVTNRSPCIRWNNNKYTFWQFSDAVSKLFLLVTGKHILVTTFLQIFIHLKKFISQKKA